MSNYLNSLVGRALRLGPVVQPRPTSLFEPVVAGPSTEPSFSEVAETTRSRQQFPDPSLRVTPEPSDLPIQKRENIARSEVTNTSIQPRQTPATVVPAPELPPSLFSLHAMENLPAARDKEPLPRVVDDDRTSESTPLLIKPEVRVVPTTTDHEQSEPSLRTPSTAAIPAQVAPPSRFSQSRSLNAQPSAPGDAVETVVVTIGRVDVRAIFPAPQAARRATRTQPQPLSLDEYLKQRNEGRR